MLDADQRWCYNVTELLSYEYDGINLLRSDKEQMPVFDVGKEYIHEKEI